MLYIFKKHSFYKMEEYSIVDQILNSSMINEERIKQELREEFYNVYVKNEMYYRNYVHGLYKIIAEREKNITELVQLLEKSMVLSFELTEKNKILKK